MSYYRYTIGILIYSKCSIMSISTFISVSINDGLLYRHRHKCRFRYRYVYNFYIYLHILDHFVRV